MYSLKMKIKIFSRKGFSLIEMLIVLAIIVVISTISIPNIKRFTSESKRDSLKPTLNYISSLFQLKYIEGGRTFGGLEITDINPSSFPKNYCIKVFTKSEPQPTFIVSSDLKGVTPNTIGTCRSGVPTGCSTDSGFVIIAYGKKQILDVGLSHEPKNQNGKSNFFLYGKDASCAKLRAQSCSTYSDSSSCRNAGCRWIVSSCLDSSNG